MGQEVRCSIRSADHQDTGNAVLENDEIIFRGELRLKIPLASLKSVSSSDGELHLVWENGSAVFQLGKYAEKWAHKILKPKSTLAKLGVKPQILISTVGMSDPEFVGELREKAAKLSATKLIDNSDLIFLAADNLASLSGAKKVAEYLADAGALWIVYPKGRQDIKEQHVLNAGRRAGLLDVKVVSFSSSHTALKFVHPKAKRSSRPKTQRA